jgi:hypothetical protein
MLKKLVVFFCVLLLVTPQLARAQTGTVSGAVIVEGSGRPLGDVHVGVVGVAGKNAITDASGRFTLSGLSGARVVLDLRLIGYRPLLDTVNVGAANLRISLVERALELNSMVVTGTADAVQKRELGTAVVSVSASDVMSQTAILNVEGLLNGRAPGVNIIPSSGQIGQQATIRVRGIGTLSLSSTPLFMWTAFGSTAAASTTSILSRSRASMCWKGRPRPRSTAPKPRAA